MAHVHVANPVTAVPKSEAASKDSDMAKTSSKSGGDPTSPVVATRVVSAKYDHLIAGMSGGVVSTFILHPLDLVKIRFAVDDGKVESRPRYLGLRHAFSSIVTQEGFRGLYKGVTPNVAGAGAAWGFYFLFYNMIKTEMQSGDSRVQLTKTKLFWAATQAGAITLTLTNPIWVVKTRLCLQYARDVPTSSSNAYKGMTDALVKITRHEGIRGLYKGFVPGLWGVSHGALQFMVYEELKHWYNVRRNLSIDTKLTTVEYLLFAAMSKFVAALTTYPYQVVRARLQDHQGNYSGAFDCVRSTVRYEGFSGLYKGLSPYLCHVVPNICLVFVIYESLVHRRNEGFSGFYKGLVPNLLRVVPATAITFVVYEKTTQLLASRRSESHQSKP